MEDTNRDALIKAIREYYMEQVVAAEIAMMGRRCDITRATESKKYRQAFDRLVLRKFGPIKQHSFNPCEPFETADMAPVTSRYFGTLAHTFVNSLLEEKPLTVTQAVELTNAALGFSVCMWTQTDKQTDPIFY